MIFLVGIFLVFSIIHKYQFFSGVIYGALSDQGFFALIKRSIFFDSFSNGRFDRLMVYLLILFFCLYLFIYNYFFRKSSFPWVFSILPIFPLFFFEGLGVMSYSALLFCLFVGMSEQVELRYKT